MDADLILVGGGLANTLIALTVRERRPEIKILLLERGPALGGNHTWCFHDADLNPVQHELVRPLVSAHWPGYEIRFPQRRRYIAGGYNAILSDQLHDVANTALRDFVRCNMDVATVEPSAVTLASGEQLTAPAVIDGRGDPGNDALDVCYQKFVGQVLALKEPHQLEGPLLMDATVEQCDGFRFIYVLPFSSNEVLIEDTRYSDSPTLDRQDMREQIENYSRQSGWSPVSCRREEEGVLPVVLGGDIGRFWADTPGVPRSGIRAGLFNYTTGYSLPEAVRCADAIAGADELTSASLYRITRSRSERLWRRGGFLRMLNRMLFLAGEPHERYRVLQHFYRLPDSTVSRFYAGRPSFGDRLRILSGRPPVPVGPALRAALSGRT